jgi:Tfp pilus assembly protein PilP
MKTAILAAIGILWLAAPVAAQVVQSQDRLPPGTRVGNGAPSGYDDGARRDPFISLMAPKKSVAAQNSTRTRPGLSSLALADVSVKGILKSGGSVMAVLEAPDGHSYVARSKDKLQDAIVKSIDAEGVVFVEQQVDAGGSVHARDIRKTLRPPTVAEGVR